MSIVSKIINTNTERAANEKMRKDLKAQAKKTGTAAENAAKSTAENTINSVKTQASNTAKNIENSTKEASTTLVSNIGATANTLVTGTIANATKTYTGKEITSKDLSAYIRTNYSGTIGDNVAHLMDNTIESIVETRLKESNKEVLEKYNEGVQLYNKLYKSDELMTTLKQRYTDNLTKTTATKVTDIASKITDPLNKNPITRGLVNNSALNQEINSFVSLIVSSAIDGIATNDDITYVGNQIRTEIDTIKKNGISYATKQFGSEIAYATKLGKATKDQIAEVEKQKQEYLKKATDALNEQREKINKAVQEMEAKAAAEINRIVKNMIAGIAKGIKVG